MFFTKQIIVLNVHKLVKTYRNLKLTFSFHSTVISIPKLKVVTITYRPSKTTGEFC